MGDEYIDLDEDSGYAKNLYDLLAQRFLVVKSYEKARNDQKQRIRQLAEDFVDIIEFPERTIRNIELGRLTPRERRFLQELDDKPEVVQELARFHHRSTLADDLFVGADDAIREGSVIQVVLNKYLEFKDQAEVDTYYLNTEDYILDQLKQIIPDGADPEDFLPEYGFLETNDKLRAFMLDRPGKSFREDTRPDTPLPYQCRIGAATFLIPPTNIKVHQAFKTGSMGGGAIRQPNSPKTNMGHSETTIEMSLFFPNHESIWGFKDDRADFNIFNWDPNPVIRDDISEIFGDVQLPGELVSDDVIDYYLSSLRGLVTQFKYAPFLPIRNQYLNQTYDITAVAMKGITITTVPDFPFVLQVNLQMCKFNYDPYMPMLDDFDQAIHWGKFRQYMGRAAARLDARANQGFLIKKAEANPYAVLTPEQEYEAAMAADELVVFEGDLLPRLNKAKDFQDGRYFDLYYPITTPSRIFGPDDTDFRQPGEDEQPSQDKWDGILTDLGLDVIEDAPSFNFFEYDRATKFITTERELLHEWLVSVNKTAYELMDKGALDLFVDHAIEEGRKKPNNYINDDNEELYRSIYQLEWFYEIFDRLTSNNKAFKDLEENRSFKDSNYVLKEWKVPMEKLDIDWDQCIVNGISVNMSNLLVKHQLQLQDEPSFQHIGGGDSSVYVSMTVFGEANLIKIRRLFQHINGLARIEQQHGVLGFLGIKNVVTALCGIKYVLPLDFEVDTIPGFPHAYSVNMSFVDFDVMQQEREKLSADQQADMIAHFGTKRNPFLRIKQKWSAFNLYPDMPLDIRDQSGSVIGHLDPDWYFRSFKSNDEDLFHWKQDKKVLNLLKTYSELKYRVNEEGRGVDGANLTRLKEIEQELRELAGISGGLPYGYTLDEQGNVRSVENIEELPNPEMRQIIGTYPTKGQEQPTKMAYIDFYEGGYFVLGDIDIASGEEFPKLGMSSFREDLASHNTNGIPAVAGTVNISEYQNEYIDKAANPNGQFRSIMQDFDYRNLKGRMLKAFPTYMLWLIDEGGQFAGIKLFDNFYGLNSVVDFSILQSQSAVEDTLILRLSNIYQKLTTPYNDLLISEDDPLFETPIGRWITTAANKQRNLDSGLFSFNEDGSPNIVDVGNVRLKPGVRIHMRMGYGSNPNSLQTVFNGVITEVAQGDIMTVIAQSDAVELTAMVNSTNAKGHSGKIDGGLLTNFWLSEPRDLMVRLLSMGSSRFKEWVSWGSKGVIFSESRFGIRHFGNILYEELTPDESLASKSIVATVVNELTGITTTGGSANQFRGLLGDSITELSEVSASSLLPTNWSTNSGIVQVGMMLWLNQASKRDYEIYKRNIYPGNGTGLAQFMGGDLIDAGIMLTTQTAIYSKEFTEDEGVVDSRPWNPVERGLDGLGDPSEEIDPIDVEKNRVLIDEIRRAYVDNIGISLEDLTDSLENPNTDGLDLLIESSDGSFLGDLLGFAGASFGLLDELIDATKLSNIAGLIPGVDSIMNYAGDKLGPFGILLKPFDYSLLGPLGLPRMSWDASRNIFSRFSNSGIGKAMGLFSEVEDDDLFGYGEVSFRAQTYMKTVWDLFETCAALLPNYIVAIRPFEDRSTVFYGKPHWLYTSGVIPITAGASRNKDVSPRLEDPDQVLSTLLQEVMSSSRTEFEHLQEIIAQSDSLKDILQFSANQDYAVDNVGLEGQMELRSEDGVLSYLEDFREEDEVTFNLYKDFLLSEDVFYITEDDFKEIWEELKNNDETLSDSELQALIDEKTGYSTNRGDLDRTDAYLEELLSKDTSRGGRTRWEEDLTNLVGTDQNKRQAITDLFKNDPITFAYQFGWAFRAIPVWIDPESGFGIDTVGTAARKVWDEDFSAGIDAPGSGKNKDEALDIWRDFRNAFPKSDEARQIYDALFPLGEAQNNYDAVMDLFMQFLWQDPYNRAWVVSAAIRERGVVPGGSWATGRGWDWDNIEQVWKQFLSRDDIALDPNNRVVAPAARAYMENNRIAGNKAGNIFTGGIEDLHNWWDNNIGQIFSIISDTIFGLISSLRLSMAQVGAATSLSGLMQQQANILNEVLMDSRYYQAGAENSLLRLVDNPFTREYGEPVIEIREPFQRVHYISSFESIISNQIRENLNEVPTVITAVSDGKNPVTVHFDKGVPPERQVERTVDTGLYWDNVFGDGLLGMFQPLIHPLEALRGLKKASLPASDELSARRVALWHLKEGLNDIYDGEIIIQGDADIRPYDLLYIADVYERMYGFVEIDQVMHHFTPDNGFVTSIIPNALVTINDPARWTAISYIWSKMNAYNMRNDFRSVMNVKAERNLAQATKDIKLGDIYSHFSTQIQGSMQYTQGNAALIRDMGAMFSGNAVEALTKRDEIWNQVAKIDITVGALKGASTIAGGVGGFFAGQGVGAAVGAAGGYAIGDLLWDGWQWVKENLLDQHGCYIQYLTKDGEPMDAGLGYYKGVAAGTNHTLELFPNIMGLNARTQNVKIDGHYRITTNDLLASIGWTEVDTVALHRETSWFVNNINAEILKIAQRSPTDSLSDSRYEVISARVLIPAGETIGDRDYAGVIDGDTITVIVNEASETFFSGQILKIRLASINTNELRVYENPDTEYSELENENEQNDLGFLAALYLKDLFSDPEKRNIAIRVDPEEKTYDRIVGVVFHNVPLGTAASQRKDTLKAYASKTPAIPFDAYLSDGRPYTLNWEMIMTGYGNVDMRESLWDTNWRDGAIQYGTGGQ